MTFKFQLHLPFIQLRVSEVLIYNLLARPICTEYLNCVCACQHIFPLQ